jgi:hypothetical protein
VNLSNESTGTFHSPFSTTRQCPECPANVRNRSFHIFSDVTSIPLHASVEIIDKKSFPDCRFLVSGATDNISVLFEFISTVLRNFDDFNPYFRFFWDHWWSILQQLPSAWIKYISRPIGIVPSQDLGMSFGCFEIVLFCKLHRSFIDWNDCLTIFCKSFLSHVNFLTYFGNSNSDFNSYPDSIEYPGVGCSCINGSKWYCQCLFKWNLYVSPNVCNHIAHL